MYKTMEQVHEEYDGQWVFMINCKKNERGSIIGGEVAIHSASRDNVISNMKKANNKISQTFMGMPAKSRKGWPCCYENSRS